MRLAFYAPMKPPDHAVPSGDRAIARALMAALTEAGAEVVLASHLRTRDGKGDADLQEQLRAAAEKEIARLIQQGHDEVWRAWITYHNYYKAPDLVGPHVASALGLPYIQIESTRARKRLVGAWSGFAQAAEQATDAADLVFYFSSRDAEALQRDAPQGQILEHLRPFLRASALPDASLQTGSIFSSGMFRHGDKLASYEIITKVLTLLGESDWHLEIAGDGPARAEVEAMMQRFGTRVRFLGQLTPVEMQAAYARAQLFLWPGVNEAIGMVYLEAQAAGVPVVAQDRPGLRDVLAPGRYPPPESGAFALATQVTDLLQDNGLRARRSAAARAYVAEHHLFPAALLTLKSGLARVGVAL